MTSSGNEVSDQELKKVIGDFLDQGLAENIVIMFRRQPSYLEWTGELLKDERMSVRLGLTMVLEELSERIPDELHRAVPSLVTLLGNSEPLWRGEAVSILGLIGTPEAINHVRSLQDDPSPQVREMVHLVLDELS